IYSEQNGIDYFLTIPKGQRMKKIDELLTIDKFEKARANSVSMTNKMIERKIGKQSIAEKVDVDEIHALLSNLKKGWESLMKEQVDRSNRLIEVSKERAFFDNETNQLKGLLEIIENLRKEEKGKGSA